MYEQYLKVRHDDATISKKFIGSFNMNLFENEIAKRKNPIIIIPERTLGNFIHATGNHLKNPYAFRANTGKYYFYHRNVDVKIVNLNHDDLKEDVLIVADRNDDYELLLDTMFYFYMC